MLPDDPRHGTTRGYAAGCKDACCKKAASRYDKERELHLIRTGTGYSVDPTGARRRIEALMALGWSGNDLADMLGWSHRNNVNRIRKCKYIERKTHKAISDLYDRLCMTPGSSPTTRSRSLAAGYAPPLAWDDIDNDPQPQAGTYEESVIFDAVAVDRAITRAQFAGVHFSNPERAEILRRWPETGRSLAELERLSGWNVHRELRKAS